MTGISPIGGAGSGFDPDRRKTPEERHAEIEQLRKKREEKWAQIRVQLESQATKDDVRKRVNPPHLGKNMDADG